MTLEDELQDIKTYYRELFMQVAKEIEARLDSGESFEQLENFYKHKWAKDLKEISKFRQQCLCSGCGVCCKFAVSEFSFEELAHKAQQGDNLAKQFISTFVPYESIEQVSEIYPEYVEFLQKLEQEDYYFYHCPKVTNNNRCPDYDNRPQICRDFPDNPLAFLPKSCSFIQWKLKSQSVCLKLNAEKEIIDFYRKGTL